MKSTRFGDICGQIKTPATAIKASRALEQPSPRTAHAFKLQCSFHRVKKSIVIQSNLINQHFGALPDHPRALKSSTSDMPFIFYNLESYTASTATRKS
jgi:hypothetical protein